MAVIIFDLDGTLIDSAPDIHRHSNAVMVEAGGVPVAFERTRSFIGNGTGVLIERMMAASGLGDDPVRHAELLGRFTARYEADFGETVLYPGSLDALRVLHATGHSLGICTNKPEAVTVATLEHFGIDGLFSAVIGGDTLPFRKPDPKTLRAAISATGAGPSLFVGDSEVDEASAEAAHIPFLLFTGGYRKRPAEEMKAIGRFEDYAALVPLVAGQFAVP